MRIIKTITNYDFYDYHYRYNNDHNNDDNNNRNIIKVNFNNYNFRNNHSKSGLL